MEGEIYKILCDLPVRPGYTYDELKDVLTEKEKDFLWGYAWAINDLSYIETDIETDIDVLDELIDGISQDALRTAKERLTITLAETLVSFGDNHPEEED